MEYTYKITLKNDEGEVYVYVYAFGYLELLNVMTRVDAESFNITVEEVSNVMTVDQFIENCPNLVAPDYWANIQEEENNNPFGLN